MRGWLIVALIVGCSGSSPAPSPPPPIAGGIPLHFEWPVGEADVHVTSEHDFGEGEVVSAAYRYHLAVQRDDTGYRITRTGLALESHEGTDRLRLGNVVVQDVTQHAGDLRMDADGAHIAPVGGLGPIAAAARTALAEAGVEGPLADAVLSLGDIGWETLNVVDYETMIHDWNGRRFELGVIQPADAIGDVEATRILSRASAPCDDEHATPICVEVIRTEQGERGHDRIQHVYTLLTEASTLRPHRFQHEARTDSEAAHVHHVEIWTTTFTWR